MLVSSHQVVLASLDQRRTKATSWHRRLLQRLSKSTINNRAPGSHRSAVGANPVIKTALISAVVICVAALLVPWRLPTASSAKRAAAARSSASAPTSPQVHALPPILVAPPTLATLPFRKPKPRPTLHPQAVTPMPVRRARRLDAQVRR